MFPFFNNNENNHNNNENINNNINNENMNINNNLNFYNMFNFMSPGLLPGIEPINYRERSVNDLLMASIVRTAMMDLLEEEIENYIESAVMRMSLEESKEIERTKPPMSFPSQRHDTLLEKQRDVTECAICLVDFEKTDMVSVTNCNHVFHNECIQEWSHYKHDCPVCREELEEDKSTT